MTMLAKQQADRPFPENLLKLPIFEKQVFKLLDLYQDIGADEAYNILRDAAINCEQDTIV